MKKAAAALLLAAATMTQTTDANRPNPLLAPWDAPRAGVPFDKIQPSDYEDAIRRGIELQNQEINAITRQRSTPTFSNTIAPLDRSGAALKNAVRTLSNLESALGDTTLMKITEKMTPLLSAHDTEIMLNRALWDRVKQVYDRRDQDTSLTPEERMLTEEVYKDFVDNGALLSETDRERYKKLQAELSALQVKFSQNVTNEMKSPAKRLWLTKDQLAGLPQSAIDAARAEAAEVLKAEKGADDPSQYLFTVFFPSYTPFMKYIDNRDLRRRMYELYNSRNLGGEYDNTQILKDIANVRLEIAKLFGYPDYASYSLRRTMAKTPEAVYSMLSELRDAYTPALQTELKEIQDFARETQGADFTLEAWDYPYWSDRLKNARYSFNDEDLRPYFGLQKTIDGVFGLATKLYGYQFKRNPEIPVYHPDVEAFEVSDRDGSFLGVLYTDFYYRPGKAPGAWMTEYRVESKDDEGNKTYPLINIVMNFSKPNGKEPALLTPYEVNTFLHEFGHALHGLSANTVYPSLSGTGVARDFVELFSQFNENYMHEQKWLDGFARHYKTGKKIPADLLARFIRAGQFGAAYSTIRQLNFGYLDMAYHTIKSPLRASADVVEFETEALVPVKIFDRAEGTLISPAFGHVFSGGYAAGYYGYKWSEELDADAFDEFKSHGIFDRKTADKFKKMLQSGGTIEPMELYVGFRGKRPTSEALMRRDGIKK